MTDLLANLDPEQHAVATAVNGPVIVLAGAGTGKTRAITHRIAYAVSTGSHQADASMAVTFTVRAANEMKARLQQLGVSGVQVRTLHASALQLVQYFWPEIIGGAPPAICDNTDAVLERALQKHGLTPDRALVRDVSAEISWTKAMRYSIDDYLQNSSSRSLTAQLTPSRISEIMQSYDQMLNANHECDLSDIVLLAAAMMEDQPRIAASFTNRYQHFTIDEYQDISPAQQHLLDQWWAGRDSVCVVGDPGQAIYGFAGANSSFLIELQQRFENATVAKLTRSYRSAPAIVHAANSFAEIPTISQRDIPGSIEINSAADVKAEAVAIASWISNQVSSGIPLNQIAVLTRLNAQLSVIDSALNQVGLATNLTQQRGGIDLMTIHAAKGLEWQAVVVAGITDQLMPYQAFGIPLTEDQYAEERRLFYVALTRAADKLLISYSRDRGASEFLGVIAADTATDLITNQSTVTKRNIPSATSTKPAVASCRFCQKGLVTSVEIASVRCDACAPWVDKDLMTKLQEWRTIQAQHEEVAEFLIFTDATLKAVAEVGDLVEAMTIGIAGITATKVEKYQADLAALFSK